MRLFLFLLLLAPPAWGALDPHQAIKDILGFTDLPRPLNTIDARNMNLPNLRFFKSPEGDFNQDGREDVAISGIFDVTEGPEYFLLIATYDPKKKKYEKLFWEAFDQPVLIHEPGTTGEEDPGNQLFSYSFCVECESGFDLYWNRKKKSFKSETWKTRRISTPAPEIPAPSEEEIDLALRLAGNHPVVLAFVQEAQERKADLGTRVTKGQDALWVWILEKGEKEKLMFRIAVSTSTEKVVEVVNEKGRLFDPKELLGENED